ncbi:FadR/GntR family transcriptional regulator [Rhizobium binxianense]
MPTQERPPLSVGRNQSLADVVYENMLALIRNGSWSARMRLPSEIELARHFGMSRPVIRQALARLREDGLIQSRQGSGSFVRSVEPEPQVQFPAIGSVADLESFLNFREGVEGEAAAVAARRRTDAELEKIHAAARRLADIAEHALLSQTDFAFHLAVAEASGNPFYVNTLTSLKEHMSLGLSLAWNFSGGRSDFRNTVIAQHAAIVAAIEAHDAGAARSAMRAHLQWERSKLMTG